MKKVVRYKFGPSIFYGTVLEIGNKDKKYCILWDWAKDPAEYEQWYFDKKIIVLLEKKCKKNEIRESSFWEQLFNPMQK